MVIQLKLLSIKDIVLDFRLRVVPFRCYSTENSAIPLYIPWVENRSSASQCVVATVEHRSVSAWTHECVNASMHITSDSSLWIQLLSSHVGGHLVLIRTSHMNSYVIRGTTAGYTSDLDLLVWYIIFVGYALNGSWWVSTAYSRNQDDGHRPNQTLNSLLILSQNQNYNLGWKIPYMSNLNFHCWLMNCYITHWKFYGLQWPQWNIG